MPNRNTNREIARPRIVIKASQHARLTDLAENATRQGLPVADFLLEELSRAHIVADEAFFPYVVQMGSHVTYTDDVAGRTHILTVLDVRSS